MYGYVRNNPLVATDPSGVYDDCISDASCDGDGPVISWPVSGGATGSTGAPSGGLILIVPGPAAGPRLTVPPQAPVIGPSLVEEAISEIVTSALTTLAPVVALMALTSKQTQQDEVIWLKTGTIPRARIAPTTTAKKKLDIE